MITGNQIMGMGGNYLNMVAWPAMGMINAGNWFLSPLVWIFMLFFVLVTLGVWCYMSVAYMEIGKKLKYKKSWMAWIPFARGVMVLQLGDFDWKWIFLLSPIVLLWPLVFFGFWGILYLGLSAAGFLSFSVLSLIAHWRFFEKRNYLGWLALVPLMGVVVPYLSVPSEAAFLIILGFVAWQDLKPIKKRKGRR